MADSTNGLANGSAQKNFRVIGTRPIRHDGIDKVTGRAKYGADYSFPGMLHGKVLRSPHAHARIKSINVDKALRLPGVKAVITGNDLPDLAGTHRDASGEMAFNPHYLSHQRRWRATRCCTTAMRSPRSPRPVPHIAEEALSLIEVEYEVLPPVLDVLEAAMKPDAPILLPEIREIHRQRTDPDRPRAPTSRPMSPRISSSSAATSRPASASADYVVEREFNTAMVHQGYIEPHNAVAHLQLRRPRDDLLLDPGHLRGAHAERARVLGMPRATSRWCRRKSAAASAARPPSISSRWRCCCPRRPAIRSRW